jgi:hypothetical protein
MSLSSKDEKGYLKVTDTADGLAVVTKKAHADELAAVYRQHGVRCRREPDVGPGEDALRFAWGEDRAQVEQLLDAYKSAPGS